MTEDFTYAQQTNLERKLPKTINFSSRSIQPRIKITPLSDPWESICWLVSHQFFLFPVVGRCV